MLRALIVDDEPSGRERLHDLLLKQGDIEIAAECANVASALAALRDAAPDAVFLDIQMPNADGFRLIDEVGERAMPPLVFVTAHEEHALRAFDVAAVDYLLKPFDEDRFLAALARVRGELSDRANRGGSRRTSERLPVRSVGRVSFLKVAEIEWVDAAHNYVRIHTTDGKTHVLRDQISKIEARLDPERFVRIHRSTIINVDAVRELKLESYGNHLVILNSGQRLTVGRKFRSRVPALLGA